MMFKMISHEQALQLIEQSQPTILDIRDELSYQQGHISSAIHLPPAKLANYVSTADKSQVILVYCYHGIGSQKVAQHLVEHGFMSVYSLIGGFEVWKEHHVDN